MPFRRLVPTLTFLLVLIIGCGDDSTTAPEPDPAFAAVIGGYSTAVYELDVAAASDGSRVICGSFIGTLHITGDPDSLESYYEDLFLASFRPNGSVAWKRVIEGTGQEFSNGMARDADDNIYIGGRYLTQTTIAGTTLTNNGLDDALVARFDSQGNLLWVLGGGATGTDIVYDIAATSDGEVFVCGTISSETTLAGEDIGDLSSASGFIVNIRSSGVGRWAATAYGPTEEPCMAVVTTGDGVLVAGQFGTLVDIAGVVTNGDVNDAYIARYALNGDPAGVIRIGGAGSTYVGEITHIDNGAVVAGWFSGTEDFNVTASGGELTSSGNDIFVARYDADGTFRWARKFGSGGDDRALDVCRIGSSDVLVGGYFEGTVQFGSKTFTSFGLMDYFVVRLDAGGNVKTAIHMGGDEEDNRLAIKASGESMTFIGMTGEDQFRLPNGSILQTNRDAFIYHQP